MKHIKLLSKETSELIAAGEVIERPLSIIKELVENSIDSGATNITVEIKNGGISYIRITDNGSGIRSGEISTAFLRHATSKISDKTDLDNITTLGFRGEALASVCAVAKVEVLTKTADEDFGTHYVIEGSVEKELEEIGCPNGTTIIVRDLFYNVPARLKFLKKDVAEGNSIADIYSKIAISHPEISFKFIRNNKQEFLTAGDGELYSAIDAVLGRELASELIPVDYELNGVKIYGYTIKPIFGRARRNLQYFFVNGRYVKAYTCTNALQEAYINSIMVGKFPACVLKLEIPPNIVDVNVHPAKIEVRFTDEKIIHDSIYFSVKNAILASAKPEPIQIKQAVPNYKAPIAENFNVGVQENLFPEKEKYNGVPFLREIENDEKFQTEIPYKYENNDENEAGILYGELPVVPEKTEYSFINEKSFIKKEVTLKEEIPLKKEVFFKIIGEAFKTYIIAETSDEVVFIDKHAAHERIIFERIRTENEELTCQFLLLPEKITVEYGLCDAISEDSSTIKKLGFDVEVLDGKTVLVRGIPAILSKFSAADLVNSLADDLIKHSKEPISEILDDIYHTIACKAAIKANYDNSETELSEIVRGVLENDGIRYCPHGRPVIFSLSKYDFDKQFKRIQ